MGPPAKKKRGSDKLDSSPGQEINAGEKSWEEKRNFNIKAKMAAVEKLTPKHPDWLWLQSPAEQLMAERSAPFDPKTECWVADPELVYVKAKIVSGEDPCEIQTENGEGLTLLEGKEPSSAAGGAGGGGGGGIAAMDATHKIEGFNELGTISQEISPGIATPLSSSLSGMRQSAGTMDDMVSSTCSSASIESAP